MLNERGVFLSTEFVSRREVHFALAAVLVSVVIFLAAAPFAKTPLAQVPAFIPIYESALVICDLITAILLFGQFTFLRSRALFVLASGYLFGASITIVHALTFPGLFAPTGLLGAGPHSTAWIYTFWHGGFPLAVIAYALLRDDVPKAIGTRSRPRGDARVAILSGIAAVLAIVCGLTALATAGQESLPAIMQGNRISATGHIVLSSAWVLSVLALAILWKRRPHTVLDSWLMVVMCAWIFDIALSAVLNAGRFDLGWYAGRIYGLLAASFLLAVLLSEYAKYYARLANLSVRLGISNQSLEQLSMRDGLTDLANRRFFDTYLAEQVLVARRHKRTPALVLCDVDAFKAFNDHYGHRAGDDCLKQVAVAIQSCCRRPADRAARYGGEEFALILPDTGQAGAAKVAEAARDAVAQLSIPDAYSPAGSFVSISGGISTSLQIIDLTAQQLIEAADQTLYQAKELGRNRMISAPAEIASAA